MAGWLAPGSRFRTGLAYAVLTLPVLFVVFALIIPPLAKATAAHARTVAACQQQALCRKFGEARQACSLAGDYKNCVDIKMGNEAMSLYPCKNDGTVFTSPNDMPGRLTCFFTFR